MNAITTGVVGCAFLLALAGCAGTPESRYYLLEPGGAPVPGYSAPGRPDRLVHVDRVKIARYADRPELVTRVDRRRVTFTAFDVWAEPPQDVLTRALVDALGADLGYGDVLVTPDGRDAPPAARLTVEVLRFDGDADGTMVLDARWALRAGPDERLVATGRERIVEPADQPADPVQRVAAIERAIGELARRLTAQVRAAAPR